MNIDRRTLLIGGGAGVGLVVALALRPRHLPSDLAEARGEQRFGHYIRIAANGRITVAVPQTETGQGIWTALPQIVADELGADWDDVAVEPAPLTGAYGNPLAVEAGVLREHPVESGERVTAGSTSVRAFAGPMREAAAVARAMLVAAAAGRWNVAPSDCEAADGLVMNSGRTFRFGELAEEAADQSPPHRPPLRQTRRARLLGQSLPRLDGPGKSDGSLRFAGDVRLPGMLFASARLAPPGGNLAGFARQAIAGQPGVRHVSAAGDWIAVAGDSWWQAERALHAANPTFSAPASAGELRTVFERALTGDARNWLSRGDYDGVTAGKQPFRATYYAAPSQHLPLESPSATARFDGDELELWVPTQAPQEARAAAAEAAGVRESAVRLYPMPVGSPSGSAFDHRAVPIAVALARSLGRPVQVTIPHSVAQGQLPVSPGVLGELRALSDPSGIPAAWSMRAAMTRANDASDQMKAAAAPPYALANLRIDAANAELPVRTGYMRGSPQREFTFFIESFVDELARAAGQEPLAFRMSLLGSNPRLARCLQAAARRAGWDGGAAGSTMGIAGASAFGSHIALVASGSIDDRQRVRADRLVAAVDCGAVINLALARQQIAGGLLWALGQATLPSPEWVAGVPRARPLGQLALPRLNDCPDIVVDFLPSTAPMGGLSGLGSLPLAPALANAIVAATGRRMRSLPFDPTSAA